MSLESKKKQNPENMLLRIMRVAEILAKAELKASEILPGDKETAGKQGSQTEISDKTQI